MALVWRGEELKRRLDRASRDAINELAGEAAADLRRSVPVRSGKLKRSIRPVKARRTENGSGYWGGVRFAWYGRLGRNRREDQRGRAGRTREAGGADRNEVSAGSLIFGVDRPKRIDLAEAARRTG